MKYGQVYIADTFANIAFIGKRGLNYFPSLNLLPPLSLVSAGVAGAPTAIDPDMEVQPTSVIWRGGRKKLYIFQFKTEKILTSMLIRS